jgi:hypothetical protein
MKNIIYIITFSAWALCVSSLWTSAYALNPSFEEETGFKDVFGENQGFTYKIGEQSITEKDNRSAASPAGPPIGGGAPIGDGIYWCAALTFLYGVCLFNRKKQLIQRFINVFNIN